MDPGEGVNGMCEDCVRQSKALKTRAGQLEALVKCTDYRQMSFKDLEAS